MNRQLIGGGTIACSAILLSGWVQPSTSDANDKCSDPLANKGSTNTANHFGNSRKHCLQRASLTLQLNPPEGFLNLQWGRQTANQLPEKIEAVYASQLEKAQSLVDREQLAQAVSTITGVPKNSRYYGKAQKLQDDWSEELMRRAKNHYQQGQIKAAMTLLMAIPATSPMSDRVTELRQNWSRQARILNQALSARKSGDWQTTISALQSLEGLPIYNSVLVQDLLQQAMMELYEPDKTLLEIATSDLPTVDSPIAPPETISLQSKQLINQL